MLRPASDADIDHLLKWRNQPSNRGVMFTTHEIGPAEHREWWTRVRDDTRREVWVFEHDGVPAGAVTFFDIDGDKGSAHWGFYLDGDGLAERGVTLAAWAEMERQVVELADDHYRLRELWCETIAANEAVLRLHERHGFRTTRTYVKSRGDDDVTVIEMVRVPLEEKVALSHAPRARPQPRLVLFGDANWPVVFPALRRSLGRGHSARRLDVHAPPFGTWRTAAASGEWGADDVLVFCQRVEDLLPGPGHLLSAADPSDLEARLKDYLDVVSETATRTAAQVAVLDLWPVGPDLYDIDAGPGRADGSWALLECLNEATVRRADREGTFGVVAWSQVVTRVGQRTANPGAAWLVGRAPCSPLAAEELSREILRCQHRTAGALTRLIVTDLDGTLWGGIIGEDGLAGIRLGGDYPGNAFTAYQLLLKEMRRRGTLLAVASKNTESVALEAIRRHPEMRLSETDFAALAISWGPKSDAIARIADDLALGLGSVMFIDDSPYEREAVRQALPDVVVPDIPDDPAARVAELTALVSLATGAPTPDDLTRAEQYRARAERRAAEASATSREDFLRSLEMTVSIDGLGDGNRARVLQLLAKTNQFNMTTRRHDHAALQRLLDRGSRVGVISVEDRFSERETIGVVIVAPEKRGAEIDTLLLSCRVLGRGIEHAAVVWAARSARGFDARELVGLRIPTDRNQPTAGLYEELGFSAQESLAGTETWILPLNDHGLDYPEWMTVDDRA